MHDFGEGRYELSYIPPVAGTYHVSVRLDEDAFDEEDNYVHIRGSPFEIECSDPWADAPALGGSADAAARSEQHAAQRPGGPTLVLHWQMASAHL